MNAAKPIGARLFIRFKDTGEEIGGYYASFGHYDEETEKDSFGVNDDCIFYYAEGVHDFEPGAALDFEVLDYELIYQGAPYTGLPG